MQPEKQVAVQRSWHGRTLGLGVFAAAVYLLGAIGWCIEGAITGLIVSFVYRVRPDLLVRRRPREPVLPASPAGGLEA